jgi:hypothetical protein
MHILYKFLFKFFNVEINYIFPKIFKMDHISSAFKKNVIKVFILPICIILIKISFLHVVVCYVHL